jgi:hypothetical protein
MTQNYGSGSVGNIWARKLMPDLNNPCKQADVLVDVQYKVKLIEWSSYHES